MSPFAMINDLNFLTENLFWLQSIYIKRKKRDNEMDKTDKVVRKSAASLYMKAVSKRKGWTRKQAEQKVAEFLYSRTKKSLYDFMEAAS